MRPEVHTVLRLLLAFVGGFLLGLAMRRGPAGPTMPCGARAHSSTAGFRCTECHRWNDAPCGRRA
jgi:hypothetical protein